MIHIRKANDRGKTELGWLHSRHSFSFGEYYDPKQMGFRSLRVINDDIVEPGKGFATHGHKDAEIFSYVLDGELEHKDSMGNGSVIQTGNLQYMSAGDGVTHSEFNPSKTQRVRFLQIWLLPNKSGGKPIYAEKELGRGPRENPLTLLFSGQPREGAIAIRQDAEVYRGNLADDQQLDVDLPSGRGAWIQVVKGKLEASGNMLDAGDGAAISDVSSLDIKAHAESEFLLFVMA